MKNCFIIILLIHTLSYPFLTEKYYQATGVLVTYKTGSGVKTRGFNINALYLKVNQNEISVHGKQTGKIIRKNFEVTRTDMDTIYLQIDEKDFKAQEVKVFFKKDTLYSNSDFISGSTHHPSNFTEVKITVRELDNYRDREIMDLFR